MSIVTCIVTHNRLDYTKKTIESYLETVRVPHYLVVVDNASDSETVEYLDSIEEIDALIPNQENEYPGKACNLGWEIGVANYPDAQFLHRSDNDVNYNPGWDTHSLSVFATFPEISQLGLLLVSGVEFDDLREKDGLHVYWHSKANVGGNQIIRRRVWDQGLRFATHRWGEGPGEDFLMSKAVRRECGGAVALLSEDWLDCLSADQWARYPEYDQRTADLRGVARNWRGERPEALQ